jgi:hypothetical protein
MMTRQNIRRAVVNAGRALGVAVAVLYLAASLVNGGMRP